MRISKKKFESIENRIYGAENKIWILERALTEINTIESDTKEPSWTSLGVRVDYKKITIREAFEALAKHLSIKFSVPQARPRVVIIDAGNDNTSNSSDSLVNNG